MRKILVCRRWTGRWSRHWFLLVFLNHVPCLLGASLPSNWNPCVRREEGGIEEERHISYFISRTAWIFFCIFKARARITWGYQSDRCFCSTAFVSPTDRWAKNIGEIWLENRQKLLYSRYSVKAHCPFYVVSRKIRKASTENRISINMNYGSY